VLSGSQHLFLLNKQLTVTLSSLSGHETMGIGPHILHAFLSQKKKKKNLDTK
jgi:hypothetical protein